MGSETAAATRGMGTDIGLGRASGISLQTSSYVLARKECDSVKCLYLCPSLTVHVCTIGQHGEGPFIKFQYKIMQWLEFSAACHRLLSVKPSERLITQSVNDGDKSCLSRVACCHCECHHRPHSVCIIMAVVADIGEPILRCRSFIARLRKTFPVVLQVQKCL